MRKFKTWIKERRPIVKIDNNGVVVSEYPSIEKAAIEHKISSCHLVNCLKGRAKSAAGFKWIYKTIEP